MKVLQIGLGNNPGGVEAFVMNYYRELVQDGIQFDFLCMYDTIAYAEEIKRLGGTIHFVPNVKKDYWGYCRKVKEILKKESYDVVHVNMLSAANVVPLRLAKKAGVKKIIAHSHNASAPGIVRKVMHIWNKPFVEHYANEYFACGKKAARWLFSKKSCENGKVILIANAIDVDKYLFSREARGKIRTELGLEGKWVIGHVGRFELQKNHKKMLDVLEKTKEKQPEVVLLCVGDGILKEEIEQEVKKRGLQEAVCFPGKRQDIGACMSAMDVFLMPSLFEGLPFTLLEAQANGLYCVVSDTITEEAQVCQEAVRSLALEADAEQWADALLAMRTTERNSMKRIQETISRHHFDIKQEAQRLKKLYLA